MAGPQPADTPVVSPGDTTMRTLWRPGVGMSVWVDGELSALSGAAADALRGRRFRHDIPVFDEGGGRRFVTTATLGVGSAIALLDSTRSIPVGGDIRWYRHLLDGVRRFVAAGAVTPSIATIDAETIVRWVAIPTPAWRSWSAVVTSDAPAALVENGGTAALADFVAEVVDHECRTRISAGGAILASTPAVSAFAALLGSDPPPADTVTTDRMRSASASWMQWNQTAPHDDSQVILRLFEPDDGDDERLRDADSPEPSPLWRLQVCRRIPDGRILPVRAHRLDPHELDRVTTTLAAAVRAFPELARAEPDRVTLDYLLTTETAEQLFRIGAAALTDAGCPVLLPRTIAEVRPVLGLRATPVATSTERAAQVGVAEVGEFEWRLALGDDPDALALSDADLADLARRQGDLVRVRGVWVRADGAALTRAATFVLTQRAQSASDHPADLGELFNLVVDDVPVPVTSISGLSWLDDIAAGGVLRPSPITPPPTLRASLRPYQQRGLEWLGYLSAHRIGGVLADDMGLGKTMQIIALLCHERDPGVADAPPGPTLIICPMSVVGNWEREIATFAPTLRVAVHHGADRADQSAFGGVFATSDVVLTTFATATRDRDILGVRRWRRVVVDEAQHIKNVATKAAKAIRGIPAGHRIALTGTPVENRLEDLRAVVDLVNPGLLGSPSTFRARFAEPIERDRDPDALRRLNGLTRPFILRREKTDPSIITDLPEKTDITVRANLSVEQAALYRAIIDDLMEALKDKQQRTIRRRTILSALTRLKQVCNHPAHYLADGSSVMRRGRHRSGKVELLVDMLSTAVAEGDRALVFTQFAAFGDLLTEWLTTSLGTPIPLLHGGIPRRERDRLVADFQTDHGPPVLIATLKAGGTGLNLTAANHVVHIDRWWNPAVEDQATDRAYRIGQHQRVQVHRFVCVGTLEEKIDEMISAKRELSRLTVSAGESWLSDIGDDELFDLFRLRAEAVSE